MNEFVKIDMREVTRLTRAGRVAEAMALLQGLAGCAAERADVPGSPQPSSSPLARLNGIRRLISRETQPPAFERAPTHWRERLRARAFPGEGFGHAARTPISVPEGARFEERASRGEAGSLTYKIYVPSGYAGQALPLVVMLHGCTQDPDDFAAGTRMNQLAEEQTFLVAYPRQSPSANAQKCWNWFKPGDQQRGGGEPALIAGAVSKLIEEFSADATRVYVAGLSAGGAAAAIMGEAYPDLFAAVGVHSGLACGSASDVPSAFAAMAGKASLPRRARRSGLPTIVFHGDADRTVNSVNGDQVIAAALQGKTYSRSAIQGQTPDGMAYTRTTGADAQGRDVLEHWVLHGAGHAWSGGSSEGSYTDARGPDASREMIRFFLNHAKARS